MTMKDTGKRIPWKYAEYFGEPCSDVFALKINEGREPSRLLSGQVQALTLHDEILSAFNDPNLFQCQAVSCGRDETRVDLLIGTTRAGLRVAFEVRLVQSLVEPEGKYLELISAMRADSIPNEVIRYE
jgi:hypothetical protein